MIKIPEISIENICKILNVENNYSKEKIFYISLNSKDKINENFCFIAIKGEKFDGGNYIEEAIKNGAKLIITEKNYKSSVPIIVVKDSRKALGLIAKELSKNRRKICVTGSSGKTTVTQMISSIISQKYNVYCTKKNENNEIGAPLTLLNGLDYEFNIVEIGMRGIGQIKWLSYICEPEISVITNVGTSHIGVLGSVDEIFKAKMEILEYTRKNAVLPSEERFKKQCLHSKFSLIFVGEDGECILQNYKYEVDGILFDIKYNGILYKDIKVNSYSLHNIYNAMFAISVGFLCGLNIEEIKLGLAKYKGIEMREELETINGITIIKDYYNASYESMKNAIITLKNFAELKNKIPKALIADMLELGEYAEEFHYRIGELAKDCGIKKLYVIGKYARNVMDGYIGGVQCYKAEDTAKLICSELTENDVLLIKGSRKMKLENVVEEMKGLLCI